MVATFRLDSPNMSYVNITQTHGSPNEEGSHSTAVRGQILNNALLTDLMIAMPDLTHVIMGGPDSSTQLQNQMQQQLYGEEIQISGTDYNGGVASTSGNHQHIGVYGEPRTSSEPLDGNLSVLPRSRSAGMSRTVNSRTGAVPRNSNPAYGPGVTVIRSTSTIEFSGSPMVGSNDFAASGESHSNSRVSQYHVNNVTPRFAKLDSLNGRHNRSNVCSGGAGGGNGAHCSVRGYDGIINSDAGGAMDANAVHALLKSQETLKKENQFLKRKIKEMVNTFHDEEKARKLLKYFDDKRKAKQFQK